VKRASNISQKSRFLVTWNGDHRRSRSDGLPPGAKISSNRKSIPTGGSLIANDYGRFETPAGLACWYNNMICQLLRWVQKGAAKINLLSCSRDFTYHQETLKMLLSAHKLHVCVVFGSQRRYFPYTTLPAFYKPRRSAFIVRYEMN
jgi:hypothetical protein